MPAVTGLMFVGWTNYTDPQPLSCLDDVRAVGPDGSIVYEHDAFAPNRDGYYRITAESVPPGAPVRRDDPVTINVVRADPTAEKPAYHPCDWVTPTEAAAFLVSATVDIPTLTSPVDNWRGATYIGCHYNSADESHGVGADLEMADAHIVDAGSEFAFFSAQDGSVGVSGVGLKAACTPDPRQPADADKHRLYVLLPGGRMYIASGFGGVSCDTLKQFAQTAIPRDV
jgi:hypothetical protein